MIALFHCHIIKYICIGEMWNDECNNDKKKRCGIERKRKLWKIVCWSVFSSVLRDTGRNRYLWNSDQLGERNLVRRKRKKRKDEDESRNCSILLRGWLSKHFFWSFEWKVKEGGEDDLDNDDNVGEYYFQLFALR